MKPIHIVCEKEDVSEIVLMPGDPLRAKYIAEKYLKDAKLINDIRNMLGYTGYYKNKRITVMASGMGIPSMGIYAYELIKFYGVKKIIRIGTCGALNEIVKIGDLIIPDKATSLSTFAASFSEDEHKTFEASKKLVNDLLNSCKKEAHVGEILTSDIFDVYSSIDYTLNKLNLKKPLAAEMECFALFHLAKRENIEAACILTCVDSKYENKIISPEERETNLNNMIETALEAIITD